MESNRSSFKTSLGFILAAAGSAIGLGNLWRFPYLAAKDGGGVFIFVYLILVVTFGFAILMSEVAIGRKTKQSALTAYGSLSKGWGWLGVVGTVIPFFITPYYAVIMGWVFKYFTVYITGEGKAAAEDTFFTGFITSNVTPLLFLVLSIVLTAFVVYRGVNKGIESISKVLLPILFVLIIGISVFSIFIQGSDATEGRTGLDGLMVYLIPNFDGMSFKDFMYVVMDAMGQLFYSISVAMGIMVTYASYFKDEDNLVKSVNRIEIFDTIVALLAGVMIIPAVYAFMGPEGMSSSGPGLMFIAIPKVFASMGSAGTVVGAVFFLMVIFAAMTSLMSLFETVVASFMDKFCWSRKKATVIEAALALVIGVAVCLGYNIMYFEFTLPNGVTGQLLDILDYMTNNILMPLLAICECLIVGWVIKPKSVIEEATKNGEHFGRKTLYIVMVKFVTPALLIFLLLSAFGIV